jgi:DNA-binding PadR family transcriptional regulator
MDIQHIILGFLMDRSMTGYDIRQRFSLSFSFFSGISYGSIYPALKSMEKDGLINTRLEIQEGTPNKKICTITKKGREAFLKALRSPLSLERYKNLFLARMFFFSHLNPEERVTYAQQYLDELNETRRKLEEIQPQIEKHADPFQHLCFTCGQRIIKDLMETIQDAAKSLKKIEKWS